MSRLASPILALVIVWPVQLDDPLVVLEQVLAVGLHVALEHGLGVGREDLDHTDKAKEGQVGEARAVAEQEGLVAKVVRDGSQVSSRKINKRCHSQVILLCR